LLEFGSIQFEESSYGRDAFLWIDVRIYCDSVHGEEAGSRRNSVKVGQSGNHVVGVLYVAGDDAGEGLDFHVKPGKWDCEKTSSLADDGAEGGRLSPFVDF